MNSHARLCLTFAVAVAVAGLALPAIASASTPATLYQAQLTGSMTFKAVQSGTIGSWTVTATVPLNGTSSAFPHETAAEQDVWIPTASVGATQTVDPLISPDYSLSTDDPNSSLTTAGSSPDVTNPWNCGPFLIDNQLGPNLGVITSAGGATSILVDWLGSAVPQGGATNQNGNANNFPMSCATDATFALQTPLTGGSGPDSGMTKFGLPWAAGYDTIRFAFGGISSTAATQTLTGTDESQTATATGQSDPNMLCNNDSTPDTCTESYLNTTESLKLTKVCSGTVTVVDGIVGGTCGSSPPPPTTKPPSGTKITKAKVNSHKHTASFSFTATGATSFQCALAKKPKKGHAAPKLTFHTCKSPKSYSHLGKGSYTFEVRGVNSAGKDPHSASKSFKIA